MSRKIIQYSLYHFGLQPWLMWCGSADIPQLYKVDFILCLSTRQSSYILIFFVPHTLLSKTVMYCNKNYINVTALTCAMKKAWDEITSNKVRAIYSAAPHWIKAVVQNGGGWVKYFFWIFTANLWMKNLCYKLDLFTPFMNLLGSSLPAQL